MKAPDTGDSPAATATRAWTPAAALDLSLIERGRVVIVGLGGTGSFLARVVAMFLASLVDLPARLVLIDGDAFEERNRERMEVRDLDNKAEVVCATLTGLFGRPRLFIRPVDVYLDAENVGDLIIERDIVLSCVDNHATRKLLGDRCAALCDAALISGGNDGVEEGKAGTYGNIQVHVRRAGRDLNPPITMFHPEIQKPKDEVPGPSCTDLAATTAPQIIFTNFFAAAVMASAFYGLLRRPAPVASQGEPAAGSADGAGGLYDEACFDILAATLVPHRFGWRVDGAPRLSVRPGGRPRGSVDEA